MIENSFDHHFSSFFKDFPRKYTKSCAMACQLIIKGTAIEILKLLKPTDMIEKWFGHHFLSTLLENIKSNPGATINPLVPRVLFGRFPTFSALISYCCRNSGKNFPKIVTPIVEIRTANMQVRLLGRCGDKNSSSYWLSNPSLTHFFASHRSVFFIIFRLASVYRKMLSGHLGGFIKKIVERNTFF